MAAAVITQPVQATYQSTYSQRSAGRSTYVSIPNIPHSSNSAVTSSNMSYSSWDSSSLPPAMDHTSRSSTMPNSSSQSASQQSDSRRRHRRLSKAGPSNTSTIETFPSFTSAPPRKGLSTSSSSKPKFKPYLRRTSGSKTKEDADQGRLDLSKSMSENAALNALDSQDLSPRSATDAVFAPPPRSSHARTLSGGSQVSVGSNTGSHRTFVHPMRQTPRPYTPATGTASPVSSEEQEENELAETDEHADQITAPNFPSRHAYSRMGRSQSIISAASTATLPTIAPTPLSHVQTAPDVSNMTHTTTAPPALPYSHLSTNNSSANLSIHSTKSSSTRSRLVSRLTKRRDTAPAAEITINTTGLSKTSYSLVASPATATTSRSSLDKTFSFTSTMSRSRSGSFSATAGSSRARDERVQAARRAFAEKEASKERRLAGASSTSSSSRRGTRGSPVKDEMLRGSGVGLAGKSSPDLFGGSGEVDSGVTARANNVGRSRRGSFGLGRLHQPRQSCGDLAGGAGAVHGGADVDAVTKMQTRAYVDAVSAEKPTSGRDSDVFDGYDNEINDRDDGLRSVKDVGFVNQKEHHHSRASRKVESQRGAAKKPKAGEVFEVENRGLNGWVRFSAWAKTRMLSRGDGGGVQRDEAVVR